MNSCISLDIFISCSPRLQHNFDKTQNRKCVRDSAILTSPNYKNTSDSFALNKSKGAQCERLLKPAKHYKLLQKKKNNQSLYLTTFNCRRNTAYRWQDWEVRRSEGNISIPCVSRSTWLTWSQSHRIWKPQSAAAIFIRGYGLNHIYI